MRAALAGRLEHPQECRFRSSSSWQVRLVVLFLESVTILSVSFIKGIEESQLFAVFNRTPFPLLFGVFKQATKEFFGSHFGFCRVQSEEFDVIGRNVHENFSEFACSSFLLTSPNIPCHTVLNQSIVSVNIQALHVIGSFVALVDFLELYFGWSWCEEE